MPRLPVPGSDDGNWGNLLNEYLGVEHNPDGSLKPSGALSSKADDSVVLHTTGNETVGGTKTFGNSPVVPTPSLGSQAANKQYVDDQISAIEGSVAGPASSTGNAIARFDGTTGKSLQNSNVTLSDTGTMEFGASSDRVISSANNSLILKQTGDMYGETRLTLQNRDGSNGAVFSNETLDLVDFGFRPSSGKRLNLRTEGRAGYALGTSGTAISELQIHDPTVGSSDNIIFAASNLASIIPGSRRLGVGLNNPAVAVDVSGEIRATVAGTNANSVVTVGGTQSLTNKTLTQPIVRGAAIVALTDTATIAVDAALGNTFTVTLAANRTMGNPTNPSDGQKIMFRIKQDATGNRTVTWSSAYRFGTDIPTPTLSSAASKTDYVGFTYNAADSTWDCIAVSRGY